jgi:DNA-binding MurR/RpiR family transcriptional regulator
LKQDESFIDRVLRIKLTPTEQKLASVIIDNIKDVAFYNSAKLADVCGVSPSVVTRLNRKLGYSGFSEFKQGIEALYHATVTPYDVYQHNLGEKGGSIADRTVALDIESLKKMYQQLNENDLETAVDIIMNAKRVFIVAVFAGEAIAKFLSISLNRLEINIQCITGLGLYKQIEYEEPMAGDVIVAISFFGIAKEVFDAAVLFKEKGALVVSLTDSRVNSLAKTSDYVFITPTSGAGFIYSHIASISMVNIFVNTISTKMNQDYLLKLLDEDRKKIQNLKLFVN